MKRNNVQNIIVHIVKSPDYIVLQKKIDELYIGYIERWLRDSGLTADQKLAVIDGILTALVQNASTKCD